MITYGSQTLGSATLVLATFSNSFLRSCSSSGSCGTSALHPIKFVNVSGTLSLTCLTCLTWMTRCVILPGTTFHTRLQDPHLLLCGSGSWPQLFSIWIRGGVRIPKKNIFKFFNCIICVIYRYRTF